MPSGTPVGDATVTVHYNGEASNAVPIKVIQHAPSIFTLSQNGIGWAVLTDLNFAVNWWGNSFAPGDLVSLWVTGLGPRSRDDIAQVEDLKDRIQIQVLVDEQPAEIVYAGPSGCCAGLDQVIIRIPENVFDSCAVSLVIVIADRVSNQVAISVSHEGPYCQVPGFLSREQIEQLVAGNEIPFVFGEFALSTQLFANASAGSGAALQALSKALAPRKAESQWSIRSAVEIDPSRTSQVLTFALLGTVVGLAGGAMGALKGLTKSQLALLLFLFMCFDDCACYRDRVLEQQQQQQLELEILIEEGFPPDIAWEILRERWATSRDQPRDRTGIIVCASSGTNVQCGESNRASKGLATQAFQLSPDERKISAIASNFGSGSSEISSSTFDRYSREKDMAFEAWEQAMLAIAQALWEAEQPRAISANRWQVAAEPTRSYRDALRRLNALKLFGFTENDQIRLAVARRDPVNGKVRETGFIVKFRGNEPLSIPEHTILSQPDTPPGPGSQVIIHIEVIPVPESLERFEIGVTTAEGEEQLVEGPVRARLVYSGIIEVQ